MTSNDKFSASLGGVTLLCQSIEDGFEKGIITQEIPYKNGASTEDTGMMAGTCSLRCYFFDANYSDHLKLIDVCKSFDLVNFIHPVYGLKRVRVNSLVVRNNDQLARTAEIDLKLTEDDTPQTTIKPWKEVQTEAETMFTDSVTEQQLSLAEKLQALASDGESACESAISSFSGFMTAVKNPANTLASLIEYGTDLPGRFTQAAALAVERYAIAYNTLRTAPTAFMAALSADLNTLAAAFDAFGPQVKAAASARLGLEAAGFFSADEQLRQTNGTAEAAAGFDVNGNRLGGSVDETLNATEIESILQTANTAIQAALAADRGNYALKRLAAALVQAAAQLKLTAENVKTVRITEPTPLMVICLRYGLPYTAAPRVLALNPQIKDPNRVSGEILIYV